MLKKTLLVVLVLGLAALQAVFLYSLKHGAEEQFMNIWAAFGVKVPAYTKFVFNTANWWWPGPATCVMLLSCALHFKSRGAAWAACVLSILLSIALFWSAYAPGLLVRFV